MRSDGWGKKTGPYFSSLLWICNLLIASIGAGLKLRPDDGPFWLQPVLDYVIARAYIAIPGLSILSLLLSAGQKRAERQKFWKPVRSALADCQRRMFESELEHDDEHAHRVTLFMYRRWAWRWPFRQGWLVPVERSSPITREGVMTWAAPANKPEMACGIAGKAYLKVKGKTVVVDNLPDVGPSAEIWDYTQPAKREAVLNTYAKRTFCERAWVERKKPVARCYLGVRVEVNSEPWGVLVVDSKCTEFKIDRAQAELRSLAAELGRLLERMS